MVGERETAYGSTPRWSVPAARPGGGARRVVLEHVEQIGLVLAARLLGAGYEVVGRDIAENCLRQFQLAGGVIASDDDQRGDAAWVVECRERPGTQPEVLARLSEQHRGYGRPRLELSGPGRVVEREGDATVGKLVVRSGAEQTSAGGLLVVLDLNPRGLQLVVHGERTLFEAALPLLTVLADRVLYAGSETVHKNEDDTLPGEPSSHDHA